MTGGDVHEVMPQGERYAHDEEFTQQVMARRTATDSAQFLLPHLQPGMRLIDCGCGQGSVTVDLAQAAAPGETIGIDVRAGDLEAARALAERRGVTNVRFQESSVYELPFPDDSFDAAFCHQVLHHLRVPTEALREIWRVLKPGGVLGTGDHMWDRVIRVPIIPELEAWDALRPRVISENGGTTTFARDHAAALRDVGFVRVESFFTTSSETFLRTRTPAQAPMAAIDVPGLPYFRAVGRRVIEEQGWASTEELDAMDAALIDWAQRPDALWVLPVCSAIAWK
jgi:SAM-dependent methyltransferase